MTFSIKNNPEIEILGTIGDKDPIAYGGGFVCRRREEGAKPWLEFCGGIEDMPEERDAAGTPRWYVYRTDVHEHVFSYLDWIIPVRRRFLAHAYGASLQEVLERGISKDVMVRASLLQDIGGFFGWNELDQYPLSLSLPELCERWGFDVTDYHDWDLDADEVTT